MLSGFAMKPRNPTAAFLAPLALSLLLYLTVSGQQGSGSKAAEEYQNRQRALSLILLDSKIKSLDDAVMRCTARREVIRFLAESGPKDLHPYAKDQARACLEETVSNRDEFLESAIGNYRTQVISLIRRIDRDEGDRLETKYQLEGSAKSFAREMELDIEEDPTRVTAKVIDEIRSGNIQSDLGRFVSLLRTKDRNLAEEVLDEVLARFESQSTQPPSYPSLFMISNPILNEMVSAQIRVRFLVVVLNLGRRALADRTNEGFTKMVIQLLAMSETSIEKYAPSNLDEARSILRTLMSALGDFENTMKETWDRINQSDDKLATAISEAESASDERLQSLLWRTVSNLAVNEGKLRIAIDAAYKVGAPIGDGWRQFMMTEAIPRRALQDDDLETIDFILGRLESAADKAQVGLFAASELAKKDGRAEAELYFNKGFEMLERSEYEYRTLNQYRMAIELSLKPGFGDVFAIARDAADAVNKIPSSKAEDTKGSEGYNAYVQGTLAQTGNTLSLIFDQLAKKDPDQAYTISQGIQRRDLRLMAEISVEKFKKYPLPVEGNEARDGKEQELKVDN